MVTCTTWWFDHVGETYLYVVGARAHDERQKAEYVEKLLHGADEWAKLTGLPEAGQLMKDHISAVKHLADSAIAGDKEGVDASVDALLLNLESQTGLYASSIQGFPKDEWHSLFQLHITATGGYILALVAGDAADFRRNMDMVIKDRNDLARLWARVCGQP